jgi:peptidoglycan/LPS O-acetylase OafA/YrhL
MAISLVLICHFAKTYEVLGFYGVELFFALSGFLIGGILFRDLITAAEWSLARAKHFWLRRWWRTLPNYYLFLLVSIIFHSCYGGLPSAKELLRYLFFSQTLLNENAFFYGVSWSLCIEEYFYLLFPLSLLVLTKARLSKKTAFIFATVLFLAAPMIIREILFRTHPAEEVRMMTLARLDSIFYGVAMAFLVHHLAISAAVRVSALYAGSGLVAVAIGLNAVRSVESATAFYRIAFVIVPAGFALMLPWLETVKILPQRLSWLAPGVRSLSLWSYSIYLCHIPILFTVYSAFGSLRNNAVMNLISKLAGLAITLAVSRMLFVYFEKPLTDLRPREMREGKAITEPASVRPSASTLPLVE